jgi:hypothetical protein
MCASQLTSSSDDLERSSRQLSSDDLDVVVGNLVRQLGQLDNSCAIYLKIDRPSP